MFKCQKCGYIGSKDDVKHAPKNLPDYGDKLICYKCFKEIKAENKKSSVVEDSASKTIPGKRCIYCGSPIEHDQKICPYCMYDYSKKKVVKREKDVVSKNISPINISNSKFPKAEDEIKKNVPKKFRYLPMISFVVVIVLGLLFANSFGMFSAFVENQELSSIEGEWTLLDMPGPADDLYDQKWIFHKNHTLIVETDYESETSNDLTNYVHWDAGKGTLELSIPFSKSDQTLIYNVEPTVYNLQLSDNNRKMTLTCETDVFQLKMELKKI